MTSFLLSWIAIFATIGLLGYGAKILSRQRALRKASRRSDKHEAFLAFAQELLEEPDILIAAVKAGSVTVEGVRAAREAIHVSYYPGVRALTAKLLEDRNVRRLVVRHMAKKHGVTRVAFMAHLSGFMAEVRG